MHIRTVRNMEKIRDIPSSELVKEIKAGWGLGNTLEAAGARDLSSETSWGNPFTTVEMITAVKNAGFNIVRIPVTWCNHMDENGSVDEKWLCRVREVVDYAYEQGMFVILNIHHENWHDPYYENEESAVRTLVNLWTQIGNHFEQYGERLIFEALNEPRKRRTSLEWNGGDEEGHQVVNHLNSAFVSTIRGLGGNNPLRHLMIPTYAASSAEPALKGFVFPEGDDKLIVSIHAYLPYEFALGDDPEENRFTAAEDKDVARFMSLLKKYFTDKGIPVIIGEFGARNKNNITDRTEWAEYYVSKAKELGIPCILFDNGHSEGRGETFGLLDRKTCDWSFPEIVQAVVKASG